jgi:hypothetical protein
MCFSEFASFTASALLIPTGIFCIKTALYKDEAYLPLSCIPLAFGIQQGCEGIVWLGINTNNPGATNFGSFAFLFFSHWFWLCWIPLLVFRLEHNRSIGKICKILTVVGCIYGALLYLPLSINSNWLSAAVVQNSIEYQAKYIGDSIPVIFTRSLYGAIILIPLLCSSHSSIKIFGSLIALSVLIAWFLFNFAFISVWCFFAALLSIYIVHIISGINTSSESFSKRVS